MNTQDIKEQLLIIFKEVASMEIRLSADEQDYDLHYVARKLATISHLSERLSDLGLLLTQQNLHIIQASRSAKALLASKEADFLGSQLYRQLPTAAERNAYIKVKLLPYKKFALQWEIIEKSVAEIKHAISDRIQTFRRLDSDLRLHEKIISAKSLMTIPAGMDGPEPAFPPGIDMELAE